VKRTSAIVSEELPFRAVKRYKVKFLQKPISFNGGNYL
jgi:hypothetical protein